ncbi:MAG TPA: AAA family ATPase, partial [Polyangiaceae bacterium]
MLERPQKLVPKEELLSQLWKDSHVTEAVLKTYLSEIRRALRESAKAPRFIETAHGRGYRFIGAVERSGGAAPQGPPADVMPVDGAHFVGRDGEIARLQRAFEQTLEHRRQVVFIAGEAGIGKTLLVKRFLERVSKRDDVSVGWGQCVDQYGSGEPYLPVLEALRRLSRGAKGDFVSQILRRDAPSWLAQMPGLLPAASAERVGPALPERMLREMAEALESLTEQRSLVLWLEDLQWADPSTLDLLSYVAQRSDPSRLLVLVTYRPLEALDSQRLSQITQHLKLRNRCEELALPYLNEHAIEHYLALRFGQHDLPAGVASELLSRTNGNALFIVTVVDWWLESGALTEANGSWRLSSPLAQLARGVPDTL